MPDQRITQYGMRLFVTGLADTLVEFHQTPLDDRDSHWLMRHFKCRLEAETVRQDLAEPHKLSIVGLFYCLDWYCLTRELQIRYEEDDHRW